MRSKTAEKGVFVSTVAICGLFTSVAFENVVLYNALLSRKARMRGVVFNPLIMVTCLKCVFPFTNGCSVRKSSQPDLLEHTMEAVCNGEFKKHTASHYYENEESHKDNLLFDLAVSTKLGFLASECPIAVLERMVWIADKGLHHLPKSDWLELKNMRKSMVADLRKFDVQKLINFSIAGVVLLNGQSDSFFHLIGNEQASVKLRCQLPKPKFEDLLSTGLAKASGSNGNYVICDIPGVSGYFKGVNVGESILLVKCSERTKFSAKKFQLVL